MPPGAELTHPKDYLSPAMSFTSLIDQFHGLQNANTQLLSQAQKVNTLLKRMQLKS